ncbi:MAG TPA: hypothetical protein VG737_14240 [Cyclobacteriaceae bacterium]|nr:hypothetical protein [Cyclobacteriaceae bacterium]
MTKRKNMVRTLTGWAQIVAVIVGFVTLYVMMDQRLDRTDQKVDVIDRRLERLELKVDNIDARLTKLENLVTLDLSWRYLYQNDPARKHLRPIYHPETNTLELISGTFTDPTTARKP